jgi:hypothetical protein
MHDCFIKVTVSQFRAGSLWTYTPPSPAKYHSRCNGIMESLFKLKVFNRLPSHIIDGGATKPNCKECGKTMKGNGKNNPFCLIYDSNENYILNGPEIYIYMFDQKKTGIKQNTGASQQHYQQIQRFVIKSGQIIPMYFQALRAAIFILDPTEIACVRKVVENRGQQWEHCMVWHALLPCITESRQCLMFWDKIDSDTLQPIFNEVGGKKRKLLLEEMREGWFSDLPGISFYARKINKDGTELSNKDGLLLCRCFRGTSILECLYHWFVKASVLNYSHSRNPSCARARTHGQIQAPREPPNYGVCSHVSTLSQDRT